MVENEFPIQRFIASGVVCKARREKEISCETWEKRCEYSLRRLSFSVWDKSG